MTSGVRMICASHPSRLLKLLQNDDFDFDSVGGRGDRFVLRMTSSSTAMRRRPLTVRLDASLIPSSRASASEVLRS